MAFVSVQRVMDNGLLDGLSLFQNIGDEIVKQCVAGPARRECSPSWRRLAPTACQACAAAACSRTVCRPPPGHDGGTYVTFRPLTLYIASWVVIPWSSFLCNPYLLFSPFLAVMWLTIMVYPVSPSIVLSPLPSSPFLPSHSSLPMIGAACLSSSCLCVVKP